MSYKKEKKERKEKKEDKEQPDYVPKDRVPFDQLPNKIKKRLEKRKAKREELKAQKKIKIDMNKSEDTLLEKYK